jgi:hypothetical protein
MYYPFDIIYNHNLLIQERVPIYERPTNVKKLIWKYISTELNKHPATKNFPGGRTYLKWLQEWKRSISKINNLIQIIPPLYNKNKKLYYPGGTLYHNKLNDFKNITNDINIIHI